MRYQKHDGKKLSVQWYGHRVNHRDGVFDVVRAERVKGYVGLIMYRLSGQDGTVIQASSNDMQACRLV